MSLGPHAAFIIASYLLTLIVIAALIGWIALDYATQQRTLARFEKRGIRRRSARGKRS